MLLATALSASSAEAASFQTLYSFNGSPDGTTPNGGFAFDKSGVLYGTTWAGGTNQSCGGGCGTLFRLDPSTGKETTVHSFSGKADGFVPNGSLVADSSGVIYGTTQLGGPTITNSVGIIFKYDPSNAAFYTIHIFGGADGRDPNSLVSDNQGTLYGTTGGGGKKNLGTLFKFDPKTGQSTVLHAFGTVAHEGQLPVGSLTFDPRGALYGAMFVYGAKGGGTLFKYDLTTNTFKTVYAFTGISDGGGPTGSMRIGAFGLLIGMTQSGGGYGYGTIFAFNPATQKLARLYNFTGGNDGGTPTGSIVPDSYGNFWGETTRGGSGNGAIFMLNVKGQLTVMHDFGYGEATKFASGLSFFNGGIYGASPYGGNNNLACGYNGTGFVGCGSVYRIQ